MEVTRASERPKAKVRLEGAMEEIRLLGWREEPALPRTDQTSPAPGWELVFARVREEACVLPVRFPTDELGLILSGRVQLTHLPDDYDITIPLEEQARIEVLGPGDAFRIDRGDRVWIEVLEALEMVYARRALEASGAGTPGKDCC